MIQGQEALSTPALKNAKYPVEGREDGEGYLNKNDSEYGVIVIQEWWGLNQNMMKITDRFASQGFQAISPDIYRGKVAKSHEDAGHLTKGLDWEGATRDIEAAGKYLRTLGCKKVGIVGFCMGGALAIASAVYSKEFDAAAPFYGIPDLNKYKLDTLSCPVYGQFGELDQAKGFCAVEDAERFLATGKQANKDVQIKIWPGVGHAFMNVDRPDAYNEEIANQALDLVTKWFKQLFEK